MCWYIDIMLSRIDSGSKFYNITYNKHDLVNATKLFQYIPSTRS